MTEQLIPPWIVPEEETQEWLDEGSSVFTAEFAPGLAQRQSYGGMRLKLSRKHKVRGDEKAQLLSILKSTKGKYKALLTKVHFANRGSFPAAELVARNTFVDGTTGWNLSNANCVLSSFDRILRSTRANVSADTQIRASSITTISGATYAARLMLMNAKGVINFRQQLGTTAGASDIATDSADLTTPGLKTLTGVASGTSAFYSILDSIGALRLTGDYLDFNYTSVSRCALVKGASQTGNSLVIDALPTSTSGLALPDDMFEINGEIKTVTAILDGDSSGNGYLQFEPALIRSPDDNDPIHFLNPMGKFLMSNLKVDNEFGTQAIVTYDLEHIYE